MGTIGSCAGESGDGGHRARNLGCVEQRWCTEDCKGNGYHDTRNRRNPGGALGAHEKTVGGRSKRRMSFPTQRPRRLRRSEALRGLVRETRLTTTGLIYPMFVCPGTKVRKEVSSMPGVHQQSVDQIVEECREVEALGLPGVILFGLPESKDAHGTTSTSAEGVVQRAIEAIRNANLKLLVITDVCLCEYTDHGHCGVIENGDVANDATLPILSAQALSHARAGADIVAPSDMMDGRVAAIRGILDNHKFADVAI